MKSLKTTMIRTSVATLGLVTLSVLGVVALVQLSIARAHLVETQEQLDGEFESKGRLLLMKQAANVRDFMATRNVEELRAHLERAIATEEDVVYAAASDRTGAVLSYADARGPSGDVAPTEAWLKLPTPRPAARGPTREIFTLEGDAVSDFSRRVIVSGQEAGILRFGVSHASLRRAKQAAEADARSRFRTTFELLGCISVLALGFGVLVTRRQAAHITSPLSELTEAVQKISGGQTGVRVDIHCGDEIESLATCFNDMARDLEAVRRGLEDRVEERTAALNQKTRDLQSMLERLRQGVFTILPGQVVHHEYSRHLEAILETSDIAGRPIVPLMFANSSLGADRLDCLRVALDSCLGTSSLNYLLNEHLLPTELELVTGWGSRKVLEAEWNPIESDDEITTSLMVTVRDVTELRELQREAGAQRRTLGALARMLTMGEETAREFLRSSETLLARCRTVLARGPLGPDGRAEIFRCLHTLKGNARTLGFAEVSDLVHGAEEIVSAPEPSLPATAELVIVGAQLRAIEGAMEGFRTLAALYSPLRGAGGEIELRIAEDVDAVSQRVQAGADVAEIGGLLAALARRLRSRPLAEMIEQPLSTLPEIAAAVGKSPPQVVLRGGETLLPSDLAQTVRNAFGHILRNAIDHGIESGPARVAKNKPERGLIEIAARVRPDAIEIEVGDDGAGLDLDRLRARGLDEALLLQEGTATDDEVAALIFKSGLSTAAQVTSISGRGVGMDAIRSFVEERGGRVELVLGATHESTRRAFSLKLLLPTSFRAPPRLKTPPPEPQAERRALPTDEVRR